MIAKLLLQNVIGLIVMSLLIFVPAGTLNWPAGWVFIATNAAFGILSGMWLAKADPDLLAERMLPGFQVGQPAADKGLMLLFSVAALVWGLSIALDKRFDSSSVPVILSVFGWMMLLLFSAVTVWTMRENSFAAPVIKLQTDRGQRVISTGPYGFVRHPMYSVAVLYFLGASLLLGSWWGVALSPLFPVLFAIRIQIEERELTKGLPGYAEYIANVRYRLFPGVW